MAELHAAGKTLGVTEGDVLGLVMMKILRHFTGRTPFFGEWAEFDPEGYAAAVAQMEANQAAEAEWAESEEAQAVCEHGLSAWLCAGPGHYPMDDDY
jgi:L-fucose isomerase-like protein